MNEENPPVVSSPEPMPAPSKRSKTKEIFSGQLPLILALLIICMLLVAWKPWSSASTGADSRTISVTGDATVTAEPDLYVFYPQYTSKATDEKVALAASTAKTNEVVSKLKALGVADSKIKTDTNGYDSYWDKTQSTYYSSLTITVDDKELAQKVQDYLLTTAPYGSVSPYADFSKDTRKKLTDKARDEATKDARAKAEQSAENLGFKIGKVKSVSDGVDNIDYFGEKSGLTTGANSAAGDQADSAPIMSGEDELPYSVRVTYYVK